MEYELMIAGADGAVYLPVAEDGVEWTTQRRSAPGKLTFTVVCGDGVQFEEGAAVRFSVDGQAVFFGFLFSMKHDRDRRISITAYDQLRYLSNKDTLVYENRTASQLVERIAADHLLRTGTLEDTKYVIASRVEENSTLFDMIENALDLTLQNTGEMFILYDDAGKLTLKNISSLLVGEDGNCLMIDGETCGNYEYASGIDRDVYDRIKLTRESSAGGAREVYIAEDSAHISAWGVLQYFEKLSDGENGQEKADALLKLYNSRMRALRLTGALGDIRVRGGSMVFVRMDLGDTRLAQLMLVEKATHTFRDGEHRMDLTLRGGEFRA